MQDAKSYVFLQLMSNLYIPQIYLHFIFGEGKLC